MIGDIQAVWGAFERLWATGWPFPVIAGVVILSGSLLFHRVVALSDRQIALLGTADDGVLGTRPAKWSRESLRRHAFGRRYREAVQAALRWTGDKLWPTAAPKRKRDSFWREVDYAFSNRALSFFLLIAVVYPLFLLLLQWGAFDGPGTIGGLEVLPDLPRAQRALLLAAFLLSGFLYWLAFSDTAFRTWPFAIEDDRLRRLVKLGAFALAFAVAGVVALAFAFAGAFAVAFAGAFAVAFAGAFAVEGLSNTLRYRRMPYPLLIVTAIGAALATARLADLPDPAEWGGIVLFLVILPLCNGVFDWLSFGTTRFLLWQTAKTPPNRQPVKIKLFLLTLLDLAAAAFFLLLLGMSIVTFAWALNLAALAGPTGAEIIDLQDKFDALRSGEDRPWWLYVMHFSTFLPSLAHLCLLAFGGLLALYPRRWNVLSARCLRPALVDYPGKRALVTVWQSLRVALPVWLVITLFWIAISLTREGKALSIVGTFYLDRIEAYARWLDAVARWLGAI